MLAPNGQTFFPDHDDWEATYIKTREVLERCVDHFEEAVDGQPLKFSLHAGDGRVLAAMYGEHVKLVTGQLHLFMNHVLSVMRMPYRMSSTGCVVTNPAVMYCSVRRETYDDIMRRMAKPPLNCF
jgi:hypothetical protein